MNFLRSGHLPALRASRQTQPEPRSVQGQTRYWKFEQRRERELGPTEGEQGQRLPCWRPLDMGQARHMIVRGCLPYNAGAAGRVGCDITPITFYVRNHGPVPIAPQHGG